jgi:hypothetical protein
MENLLHNATVSEYFQPVTIISAISRYLARQFSKFSHFSTQPIFLGLAGADDWESAKLDEAYAYLKVISINPILEPISTKAFTMKFLRTFLFSAAIVKAIE